MGVFPDFDGLGGIGDLRAVVGALLTFVLIVAVLMLIVSAIVWAIATAHGNYATASKGRIGVLVAVGAAVLAGGGVAWMNWLLTVGSSCSCVVAVIGLIPPRRRSLSRTGRAGARGNCMPRGAPSLPARTVRCACASSRCGP